MNTLKNYKASVLLLVAFLCHYASLSAQGINTSGGQSAQFLLEEVLLGNSCAEVSNIQVIGDGSIGIGSFSNGASSIGMDTGVIFSTGDVDDAQGPNNQSDTGVLASAGGSDSDLDILAPPGTGTFNATGIEFDFTPTSDVISFNYVFASEEYCEFVNSTFNDVFGFFISGPGFNGPFAGNAENIALVPGTTQEVAINSVNSQSNAAFYIDNVPIGQPQFSTGCTPGELNSPAAAATEIEYDGFTTVLTAMANVQPCETYHIRLVVGDVGDPIYDSAVFLEANSFNISGDISFDFDFPTLEDSGVVYEGCGSDGFILFEREAGSDDSEEIIVDFSVSSLSTATEGVDFSILPTQIIIPAGENEFLLPITVFNDFITEGTETIVIELDNACSCELTTIELEIEELPPLEVQIPDLDICSGQTSLEAQVNGGLADYSYEWSTGSTDTEITIDPDDVEDSYSVTVTDDCGNTAVATANVITGSEETATLVGSANICNNTIIGELNIVFTGAGPWDITYSIDGDLQAPITGISNTPFPLPIDQAGVYELESLSVNTCDASVQGSVEVTMTSLDAFLFATPSSCFDSNDSSIELIVDSDNNNYNILWSNNSTSENLSNLAAGTYSVTISDDNGCEHTDFIEITAPDPILANLEALSPVTCIDPTGGSVALNLDGGTPPFDYQWSNGSELPEPEDMLAGLHTLTITDANDCSAEFSVVIEEDLAMPTANTTASEPLNCLVTSVTLDAAGSTANGPLDYSWLDENGDVISTNEITDVHLPGEYTLIVTNTNNGCVDQTSLTITEDIIDPVPIAADEILDCSQTEVTLDASLSTANGTMSFLWLNESGDNMGAEATLNVTEAGFYTLITTDENNGCTASLDVEVLEGSPAPIAMAFAAHNLDCDNPSVLLEGFGSSTGSNIDYEWFDENNILIGDDLNAEAVSAGTYTLVVTDNNTTCTATEQVTITSNSDLPNIDAFVDGILNCSTSAVNLDASATTASGPISFQWIDENNNSISNQAIHSVTQAGIYTLIVINDNNGCEAQAILEVLNDTIMPIALAGEDQTLNCINTSVNLDASNSSAANTIAYQWMDANGDIISNDPILTVESPGDYTLQVTDIDNTCTALDEVSVFSDMDAPTALATVDGILNCSTAFVNLDASASTGNGSLSFQWLDDNNELISIASTDTVSQAGIYNLIVTDNSNGCEAQTSIEVLSDMLIPIANAGLDDTLACTTSNIMLNGSASSMGNNISYEWLDENDLLVSTELNPLITEAGNYTLVVTNTENTCSAQDEVHIFANTEAPIVSAFVNDVLDCNTNTVSLIATATNGNNMLSFQWLDSDNNLLSTNTTTAVSQTGFYTFIATNNSNGCEAQTSVEVIEDLSPPIAEAGDEQTLNCIQTSLTLDANASAPANGMNSISYEWLDPNGLSISADAIIEINTSGNYTLIITDNHNGCTAQDQVLVLNDMDAPHIDAVVEGVLNCNNSSTVLNASASNGNGMLSFEWLDSNATSISTNAIHSVSQAGMYTVVITDASNGCENQATVEVISDMQAPLADAGADQFLACFQENTTLSASNSSSGNNISYEWFDAAGTLIGTTQNITVSVLGGYDLIVTDNNNGCTAQDQVSFISNISFPNIIIASPDTLNCAIQEVVLDASASEQGNHINYTWLDDNNNILSNNLTLSVNSAGLYHFVATNSDNNCISEQSINVTQDTTAPLAVITPLAPSILNCLIDTVRLSAINSTPFNELSLEWSTNNGHILGATNSEIVEVGAAANYALLVTNQNNHCTHSTSYIVGEDIIAPNIIIATPDELTCSVTEVAIHAVNNSGAGTFSYSWTANNGLDLSNEQGLDISVAAAGTYQLSASNTINGCVASSTVSVSQDITPPLALASVDDNLDCITTSVPLSGLGSSEGTHISYQWEGNGILSGHTTLSPIVEQAGVYTITVMDNNNGCSQIANTTVMINNNRPIDLAFDIQPPPCPEHTASIEVLNVIGGEAPYLFSIDGGNAFNNSSFFNTLQPGLYDVVVQDAIGCEYEETVLIPQAQEVAVQLGVDLQLELGDEEQINGISNLLGNQIASITWSPTTGLSCNDCLRPFASPLESTTYTLTIVSSNGCIASDKITLFVSKDRDIYIPNAFSPNLDGTNDLFYIFSDRKSVKNIKSFLVFNRWGESVFEDYNFMPDNPAHGWDGKFKGATLNPAVFVYVAEIEFIDGSVEIFSGDVTLVR